MLMTAHGISPTLALWQYHRGRLGAPVLDKSSSPQLVQSACYAACQTMAGPDAWGWVERISWAVTIPGLPIAITGLLFIWLEQRRIARDLGRRPQLQVGFLPAKTRAPGEPIIPVETIEIKPAWNPGQEKSDPVTIDIACYNGGNRAARDVLYNIQVQRGFEMIATKPSQEEHVAVNPATRLHMWHYKDEVINPGDTTSFETTVAVMKGREKIKYYIEVSYDSGKLFSEHLITVRQE